MAKAFHGSGVRRVRPQPRTGHDPSPVGRSASAAPHRSSPTRPKAVWRALTDPELHARRWAAGDVRAELGHRFALDMGRCGHQECEVLAVEPERLLGHGFAPGTLDTTVTCRLEAEGTGTRPFLDHAGFDLDSPLGRAAFEGTGRGRPRLLRRVSPVLHG
ncbi:SRPBCC domain-containing protein [Streptomyces sp. NBC_00233]|uniref:SRPBCC family protein n=1 Tax=Streptomyces sp. NBC_00233 TaxID=2975686 RepID=UPI002252C541|nr:SRPBCC domain-containing protein [Streptomyces sp. NBC_00233]MCX5230000.1 SRPBCC domain-containing protein [Streptomyces sp. NBC_00233]